MDTGTAPKIVDKPWGREIWYAHTDRYAGKILEVTAGHLLSLQKHVVKHETLYLLSGRMTFTRNGDTFEWLPGVAIEIPVQLLQSRLHIGCCVGSAGRGR